MSSPSTTLNVFDTGVYPTSLLTIKSDEGMITSSSPPKPLLIGAPSSSKPEAGAEFPVLFLLHGFILYNHFYSQLILHIASHGFIVIAPQLYTIAGPDSSEEIKATATIIEWASKHLKDVLPPNIQPNLNKLAISGHSRGGKVAFGIALNKLIKSPIKISALIGIDPVDGMDKGNQTPPPILTYTPKSFQLDGMPVLIIGSEFGEMKKNILFPPCAPKGVNHRDFYDETQKPSWYFVLKDHGHLDMLDDDTKGLRGKCTYCLCKNGKQREPMRKFVGGLIVAFLNAYLNGDDSKLIAIRDEKETTIPVKFSKVDVRL
ncbi:chlorophyllase-2 [Amaranthus tricolor]|uniref:chlorophyllase-2 n=1 Tax=Amaranthus tricolor TaxID=29722 RepID=UPI002589A85B|nr:chlorophyllase-2 [Amaranthus tricolor]